MNLVVIENKALFHFQNGDCFLKQGMEVLNLTWAVEQRNGTLGRGNVVAPLITAGSGSFPFPNAGNACTERFKILFGKSQDGGSERNVDPPAMLAPPGNAMRRFLKPFEVAHKEWKKGDGEGNSPGRNRLLVYLEKACFFRERFLKRLE